MDRHAAWQRVKLAADGLGRAIGSDDGADNRADVAALRSCRVGVRFAVDRSLKRVRLPAREDVGMVWK